MLTLHYITACVLCVVVHSSPPGYSKNVLNEVRNYIERSELDDVDSLDDQAGYSKNVLNEVRNYIERSELDDVDSLDDQADTRNVHSNISKKAMWNFSNQMIAIFGISRAISLLDYGCYCGNGGAGTPVDGIDRCCQVHDKCYGDEEGWWCRPKVQAYRYKIMYGRTVYCKDSYGSCKYRVCRCDKLFIDCLHRNTYNQANYNNC